MLPYVVGLVFVVIVLMSQHLSRRVVAKKQAVQGSTILGSYLGLMGSFCGITLAFMLNAAWSNHEQTREVINQEAQMLGSIAYFGRGLPHPFDQNVINQAQRYAQTVIDDEWPSLSKNQQSLKLNHESAKLGLVILHYQPKDAIGNGLRQQLLESFAQLRTLRSERRLKARYQIPHELWVFIIFGAFNILFFCVMLEMDYHRFHLAQTGIIATFLALSLSITWDLQNPFQGFSAVSPAPFTYFQEDSFMNETAWQKLNDEPLIISPLE